MATRQLFPLLLAVLFATSVGCCGGLANRGLSGGCDSCGDSLASCGLPDAACGLPDASCGLSDASCGLADSCCDELASCGLPGDCDSCASNVGCGSPVVGQCRLLRRIRNALCGNSSYGSGVYWNEWQDSPPSGCNECNSRTASSQYPRNSKLNSARQIAREDLGTIYR